MSTRYISNAVVALLGGLVVVLTFALSSTVGVAWVAFAVAIGVIGVSALSQLDRRRGLAQRLLDAMMIVVGGTLIGTSIVFGGTLVVWLAFALALGFVGLAFGGMTLHEVETWRSAHWLDELHWLVPEARRPAIGEVPPRGEHEAMAPTGEATTNQPRAA